MEEQGDEALVHLQRLVLALSNLSSAVLGEQPSGVENVIPVVIE